MNTQRLYEELSAARNEVVKAASAHLFTGGSKADLADALLAERLARLRFDAAVRAERAAEVVS